MARLSTGLLVLVCVVGCLTGCQPPIQADISPDGKTVALTENGRLILRDASGKQVDRVISLEGAQSPVFSPDGKWIAVSQPKRALLIERSSSRLVNLPLVSPPFAWKPDSTELAGCRGSKATVIHIPSLSVVRAYQLPEEPKYAVWVGNGRDLAFASAHKIMSIQHGDLSSKSVEGNVCVFGVDRSRQSVLWAETRSTTLPNNVPDAQILIKECPMDLIGTPTVFGNATVAEALGAEGRFTWPTSLSVSPDGSRIAFVGVVDASQPGLMNRYAELGGFNQGAVSKSLRSRLREMEKQMRFESVCTTLSLRGTAIRPTKLITRSAFNLYSASTWSEDGQTLAVVLDNEVLTRKVP